MKEAIIGRLMDLEELDGVHVTIGANQNQIMLTHTRKHMPNFKFVWVTDNHFVGYIVHNDADDINAIDALVSLYSPLEVSHFVNMYVSLIAIVARRRVG